MILAVDQSLCCTGWLLGDSASIKAFGAIRTKKGKGRISLDDAYRCAQIADGLIEKADKATVIFAEIPGGTQSSRAAKALGIALGCVVGVSTATKIPIGWITPRQGKSALTGDPGASKEAMVKAAGFWMPGISELVKPEAEAVADALGVYLAALNTPLGRLALGIQGSPSASSTTRSR